MGTAPRENEDESADQEVPEEVLDGIQDVVEGRLATKEDLADALKF